MSGEIIASLAVGVAMAGIRAGSTGTLARRPVCRAGTGRRDRRDTIVAGAYPGRMAGGRG